MIPQRSGTPFGEVMLTEYLQDIFDGELPTVISDSAVSGQWAASAGLPFSYLRDLGGAAPAAAFVVLTKDENYAKQDVLHGLFAQSKSLWFPLAAFDGSDEAVSYSLRHLESMDFPALLRGHQAALKFMEETTKVSFEGSRGTDIEVAFGAEVEFTMLTDLKVLVGDPSPLACFFEFETEIWEEQMGARKSLLPFAVNGVIRPSGILTAYGPGRYGAGHAAVRQARQLARRAATVRTTVQICDDVISFIKMDADDVTDEFSALAGPHGLHISEFAIGFYRAATGSLDWRVNSPVNEGVQGIHLGIGDGYSGMHFDFVCDDVISDDVISPPSSS
jgi:hypothetical protein